MPVVVGDRAMQAVHSDYISSIARAGGTAVVIPCNTTSGDETLTHLSGLLLSGGGDVGPEGYGETPAAETAGVEPGRDQVEIALVRRAVELGLPVLGICRGCQVMNVALGGSLIQHVPAVGPNHLVMRPRDEASHSVTVAPASALEQIVGGSMIWVNSFHHQAVGRLAHDLVAVAWSDDGLVEAIEHRSAPMLGVQWHPENMHDQPVQTALFDWFVRCTTQFRSSMCGTS